MTRRSPRRRSPQLARDATGPVLSAEDLADRLIRAGARPEDARAIYKLPPLVGPATEPETLAARHLGLEDLGRTIEILPDRRYTSHPSAGTQAGVLVGYAPGEIVTAMSPDLPDRAYRKLILRYGTVTERVSVDLNAAIRALPHPTR